MRRDDALRVRISRALTAAPRVSDRAAAAQRLLPARSISFAPKSFFSSLNSPRPENVYAAGGR